MKSLLDGIKNKIGHHQDVQQSLASSFTTTPNLDSHIINTESSALAERTFQYFYSKKNNQFQGKVKSESTLGSENDFGYVVWPVSIMLHAAADCLSPQRIYQTVSAHQKYWNCERHAFCAWKMFPGNNDIYYDDNAHAVQALISAYEATGERTYYFQASDILINFIIRDAKGGGVDGIQWHVSNDKVRAACSTGPAIISAFRICAIGLDNKAHERLRSFAINSLKWLKETLQDPSDKLIFDGVVYKDDGSMDINRTKWTYNTGFAIHGFTLAYEATSDVEYLDSAIEIAEAALNTRSILFDHSIPFPSQRMFSDGSFFLHHLVDGYLALAKHTHTEKIRDEIIRIAAWGREFMFDPMDGLYYRGCVPYSISIDHVKRFNQKFGLCKSLETNEQERDENGILCKTMLGCASWARILHAAEVVREYKIAPDHVSSSA